MKGGDLLNHSAVPIDPAGPAVPDAEILLVDPGGGLIERLSTDRSGEFASKQALTDRFDLLVRSFGFVTFRAQVFIAPDASSSAALNIQLGNVGSCSFARVQ